MKRLLLLILCAAFLSAGCHTLDDMDDYGGPSSEKRPEVQPPNWPNEYPL
jgi:hypothetical protein